MGGPKESMRPYSESASSVEQAERLHGRDGMREEESATKDQEKLVEHIIGLLRRLVSAFRDGDES